MELTEMELSSKKNHPFFVSFIGISIAHPFLLIDLIGFTLQNVVCLQFSSSLQSVDSFTNQMTFSIEAMIVIVRVQLNCASLAGCKQAKKMENPIRPIKFHAMQSK